MSSFTIGIASYNQKEFLREAIESALSQDLRCEVIVCDDGSTDGSLEIAKSYPVKVISQVNKGLVSARNSIIMNATGEYVIFLDADDVFLPALMTEIHRVITQTNADIIAPSFKEFGERDREVILMPNPTLEDFKTGNRIGYFSAIKRSALLEVGGYNPKMTWGAEDYDLWHDLLKRGKVLITIPEVLVQYRVKKESMWTETQKHTEAFMAQIKKNHPEVYA